MTAIVVTGMGCVTPCGNSVPSLWDNLCHGRSGIAPITRFDSAQHDVHIAGEVKNFEPHSYGLAPKDVRRLDLFAQYGFAAAAEAITNSGLLETTRNYVPERIGVVIGTGMGGLGWIEQQSAVYHKSGPRRVAATLVPAAVPDVAANEIALRYRFRGPSCAVTTACSSGNDALIFAARCIRDGTADVMIAGGAEATVTPLSIATFGNLLALSKSTAEPTAVSRPFDNSRSGFVMGEGAGVVVLESLEHATRRRARIYAIFAGYGQTSDAHHRIAPDPNGYGASRAIQDALKMAGISPGEVDYINAHGTSTTANDVMETIAIKRALGTTAARNTAISSTKSMTGHLIGATGAVEAIVAVQTIVTGLIPPTINLEDPDPNCDLDYVPLAARRTDVRVALSNTFGFGGHNATVVFVSAPARLPR